MEAILFCSTSAEATGIRSADDLDAEFVAEPLVVSSPRVFAILAQVAAAEGDAARHETPGLAPLRDATCQSFPVWEVSESFADSLGGLGESQVDDLVERWRSALGSETLEADPYELSTWLVELQGAWKESDRRTEGLFVLFEEKAMTF